MGAALRDPLLGEHLWWAWDKLGSPLEDGGIVNEPQGLSRSRRLLKPTRDMEIDAILGARQGQLAASSSLQWLCPFCSVLSSCSTHLVPAQPKLSSR